MPRVGVGASVYMGAVMEYLAAEILELAGNPAKDNKKSGIIPRHLQLAIRNDCDQASCRCDNCPRWCSSQHPGCPPVNEECKCQGESLSFCISAEINIYCADHGVFARGATESLFP